MNMASSGAKKEELNKIYSGISEHVYNSAGRELEERRVQGANPVKMTIATDPVNIRKAPPK